jgi:hypothetical protein
MSKSFEIFDHWPTFIAVGLSTVIGVITLEEKLGVELELSFLRPDVEAPNADDPLPPEPSVPLGQNPGWDDRTPLEYMSHYFEIDDPYLADKLSGFGTVYWVGRYSGTGALIAPDVVLSTGHAFAKSGQWLTNSGHHTPEHNPSDGSIYLAVCGRSYEFIHIELGSMSPRQNLGKDYAIARLAEPACAEAQPLRAEELSDRAIEEHDPNDEILISLGSYPFASLPRYVNHPFFSQNPSQHRNHLFGTRCKMVGHRDTGDDAGLIMTNGCWGRPGSSGAPLIVSRDSGETYRIIGVANSYSKTDSEFNNFTRVTGRFASHLMRFAPDIFDPLATGE